MHMTSMECSLFFFFSLNCMTYDCAEYVSHLILTGYGSLGTGYAQPGEAQHQWYKEWLRRIVIFLTNEYQCLKWACSNILPIICYSINSTRNDFPVPAGLMACRCSLYTRIPHHPHYTYTYTLISVTHFCSEAGITDLSALILWALVWFSVNVFLLAPSFQNVFPNLLLCLCKYTAASKPGKVHLSEYLL